MNKDNYGMNKREFTKRILAATGVITCSPMMGYSGGVSDRLWKWSKEGLYWSSTPRWYQVPDMSK